MLRTSVVALIAFSSVVSIAGCADAGSDQAITPEVVGSTSQELRQKAPTPAAINVGYFSRAASTAFAQTNGYFADEKLTVTEFQTPSSPVIFTNLRSGTWPIILTQSDNVFNYRYNASNPIGATFSPVIIAGQDHSNGASLVTRGTLTTCESIRGKTLEVDSPNSGFAFVAYGILRNKCSFERTTDYAIKVTGGTPFRYANLVAGTSDMTILNAGYQFRAEAQGFFEFGAITDAANPYMGTGVVAERSWLDANGDVASRFIRALRRGTEFVIDPKNKAIVLAYLLTAAAGDANVAQKAYDTLLSADQGFIGNLKLDRKGLYEVAQLRDAFGGFDQPENLRFLVSPRSGMYDLSYYRKSFIGGEGCDRDDDDDDGHGHGHH